MFPSLAPDPPHPDSVPVQCGPPHTLLLPDDAAGGHRYRLLTKVQRVGSVWLLQMHLRCNSIQTLRTVGRIVYFYFRVFLCNRVQLAVFVFNDIAGLATTA